MSPVINLEKTGAQKLSTTEEAMRTLTRAIHDEVYKSGQRLVEAQLTRDLGISRGSLREVLQRLAANGLVEMEPHRGGLVKRISRDTVMEILDTREVLEGQAAAQAARNAQAPENREKLQSMLELNKQLQKDSSNLDFLEDNTRFHHFILELSENKTLQNLLEQLQLPGFRSRFFSQVSDSSWQQSLREHQALLEAICEGDALLAEQLMRAHVRRVRRHFAALPEAMFDAPDT